MPMKNLYVFCPLNFFVLLICIICKLLWYKLTNSWFCSRLDKLILKLRPAFLSIFPDFMPNFIESVDTHRGIGYHSILLDILVISIPCFSKSLIYWQVYGRFNFLIVNNNGVTWYVTLELFLLFLLASYVFIVLSCILFPSCRYGGNGIRLAIRVLRLTNIPWTHFFEAFRFQIIKLEQSIV